MSNYADFILNSNCIFTATDQKTISGYVAIKNDRILSIGEGSASSEIVNNNTKFLDFGDHTITPGFSDIHCFFTGYSVAFVGVDLSKATSPDEVLSLTSDYAKTLANDKPIWGHGLNPEMLPICDFSLLNRTFPDRVVLLFTEGCESCWMNQKAIEKYQFTPDKCYPESYVHFLDELLRDRNFIVPEFKRYMKMMNSKGVTSVKEMGFDHFYGFTDVLSDLENNNELTLRVSFMSQPVAEPINLEYGKAMRDKFKGEFVHFSGYNQMTDGSISELCADLKQPYVCADTTCEQKIDWQLLGNDVRAADKEGFRFSLHAQGDAAIAKVLNIYETCQKNRNGKLINRHSITDLEFSDPEDLEHMGNLGVIAEIYPQIQSIANRKDKLAMINEKIGMKRGQYYWNRRKMADSHICLSCGTDLPLLIDDIPQSIYHAVGGYFPEGGKPFNESNTLTISELLTAWCAGGAYNLYQEKELGTLETGKKADIVVFDGNLFETSLNDIRSCKVSHTFVNGQLVYQSN